MKVFHIIILFWISICMSPSIKMIILGFVVCGGGGGVILMAGHNKIISLGVIVQDRGSLSLVHSPDHPCGIMSMSNVPTNTRGEFTGVRRDLYSSHQGLWSNSSCNTPGATINAGPAGGTYSNLQVRFRFGRNRLKNLAFDLDIGIFQKVNSLSQSRIYNMIYTI